MHVVLCYDVVSDARRTKLHTALHGFLKPVQKSVFEGPLPPGRYNDLLKMVKKAINHETDTVRIYQLCRGCVALTDHIGTAQIVEEPDDIII